MPQLKINDLCLVEVGGQYEFAKVDYTSDTHISVQTMSGGYLGGLIGSLNIVKPTGAEAGYADAVEWATESFDGGE
jgi:hypothetical protein